MYSHSRKVILPLCSLYFGIIFFSLYLYKSGFNIVLSIETFGIFHSFLETALSIIAASIFFLIHYSYPYEKNTKYLISGSLFLTVAMINTYHLYSSYVSSMHYKMITSSMSYLIFAITIILLASLPDRESSIKRWTTIVIPALMTLLCFIWIRFDSKVTKIFFIYGEGITDIQKNFNIYLGFIYLIALILSIKQCIKQKNSENISLLNGILFFILSWFFTFLYKYPSDIYSMMLHIFKVIAVSFMFKGYFVTSIKKPYERLTEARRYAEEASGIKTDFIINLSHELRTPINVIINAIRIIEHNQIHSSKYINSIEKNALRLNKLCESIIHFNEIEHDLVKVVDSEVDVVYLIDEILEEAETIADEKGLEILFDFENGGTVVTDSEKLKIILLNLLSNAFKYAPKKGFVRIILNISEALELTILNNGPNIPKSEVEKIFQKFYKAKDNDLISTEGLGIGLYISRKYAEFLGGSISIVNHEKFTGYKLILPVKQSNCTSHNAPVYNVKGFFSDIN